MAAPPPDRPHSGKRRKGPALAPLAKFTPAEERPATPEAPANLSSSATLFINEVEVPTATSDLLSISVLGRGAYGVVEHMRHKDCEDVQMAVKRIRYAASSNMNPAEHRRMMMDLDVSMRLSNFPYTIQFYGALFEEGDVWLCMELMTASLDNFYKQIIIDNDKLSLTNSAPTKIPEHVLGAIAFSVVKALEYLHTSLNVIHRDVKPSNILVNKDGTVKLCDFGISGQLVDSYAKTMTAGCKPYMAPERISSAAGSKGYDVRSDVWSLGITIVELACLAYPYASWKTPFDQLKAVVCQSSPTIPCSELGYTSTLANFVEVCLVKDTKDRPKYKKLLLHPFLETHRIDESEKVVCKCPDPVDIQTFVRPILESLKS